LNPVTDAKRILARRAGRIAGDRIAKPANTDFKSAIERLKGSIRDVPDFPKKGIIFKDITPILSNGQLFRLAVTIFAERYQRKSVEKIVAIDARGFIFFTNYHSRKGRELTANPAAALTFYWAELERQVCVAGIVEKLPVAESETYFKSRPRGSQLGAWASNQSDRLADRTDLEKRWGEMEKKFPGAIPLPDNWGGFVLKPDRIEFWQGRPSRLHDRFSYVRQPDGQWRIERLSP